MRELKIGDRVVYKSDGDFVFLRGKTGTIKALCGMNMAVEFDEFINGHDCHISGTKTKYGHGYFCDKRNLSLIPKFKVGDSVRVQGITDHRAKYNGNIFTIEMINPNGKIGYDEPHYSVGESFIVYESELVPVSDKIVITTDGKTTVATLYDGDKVVKEAKANCSPEDKFDFTQGAKLAFERLTHTFKFEVGKMYANYDNSVIIRITSAERMSHDNRYKYEYVKGAKCFCFFDEQSVFAKTLKPYEPSKVYNGKVVCIKTVYPEFWTVGKVYHVVDGVTHTNTGSRRDKITAENLRHIGGNGNEFIPLVE